MKPALSLLALLAAAPALAEDTRQLDAHEHGVGALNIAIDGSTVLMEFKAPGADIVGFEYAAESDADLAAIDAALDTLKAPLQLFTLPDAAGCALTDAAAELESEVEHDDHHDDDHDHDHEEHAEKDDHGHDDHGRDDHGDEDHAEKDDHAHDDHDDHAHDDHAEDAGHTEFHAEYALTCDNPDALTEITFTYFDAFPNALEVEVQMISASGAQAFEVERDTPTLDLER